MATILNIETSTEVCSVALTSEGQVLDHRENYEGQTHATLLSQYVKEMLDYAHSREMKIDAIAVSIGPGSYTGLRIGLSEAKGLAFGLNVPLIGVNTLQLLSVSTMFNHFIDEENLLYVPMIDARRMEVYTTGADGSPRAVVVESEESLLTPSLSGEGREGAFFFYFGDGAAKCRSVLTSPNWHYIPDIVPEARFVASCLATISGPSRTITDLAYYEPFYLKDFIAAPSHVKGLR